MKKITELTVKVDKADIIGEYKVSMKVKSFKKSVCPYIDLFYKELADKMGIPLTQLNVSNVCLNKKTCEKLSKAVYSWVKNVHKSYNVDMTYAMHHLSFGPVAIDEPWAEDDTVYIRQVGP